MHEVIWNLIRLKRRFFPEFQVDRLPFLEGISWKINQALKRFPIRVQDDIKMYLDQLDTLELGLNRIYEPEITTLLKRNAKPGFAVLDIGAHIGYYTLILAKIVGENGKVYAFEPSPSNYSILNKNIVINKLNNIQAVNMAVSDLSEEITLFESDSNSGDHRIYKSSESRKTLRVKAIKLDEMSALFERAINIVKIDVQGAEFRALLGMRNLIETNKEILLITEFWPYGINMAGDNPEAYINELFGLGFKIFELSGRELCHINTYSELSRGYAINDPDAYTNLICAKNLSSLIDINLSLQENAASKA